MKIEMHGGFNFKIETLKDSSTGELVCRTVAAYGKLIDKKTKVKDSSIPEPLTGPTGLSFDKGHIIAQEFGGPNISINICPMYAYFNRKGGWKSIERRLKSDIHENNYVAIEITYDEDDIWKPHIFKVLASKVSIVSATGGEKITMKVHAAAPYKMDKEIRNNIEKYLPEAKPKKRPYEFMDIHRYEWNLPDIKDTTEFSTKEKTYIRTANCLWSLKGPDKGLLMSDSKDDIHKNLNLMGNEDFPEVDHILAKSHRGSNAFRNAQLVSWYFNNSKRANMSGLTAKEQENENSKTELLKSEKGLRSADKLGRGARGKRTLEEMG
jgi:hypothetical protein